MTDCVCKQYIDCAKVLDGCHATCVYNDNIDNEVYTRQNIRQNKWTVAYIISLVNINVQTKVTYCACENRVFLV